MSWSPLGFHVFLCIHSSAAYLQVQRCSRMFQLFFNGSTSLGGITDSMDPSCASSGSWGWPGKPGVLRSMGSQRDRCDWATGLDWTGLGPMFTVRVCASYLLLTNCIRNHLKAQWLRTAFPLGTSLRWRKAQWVSPAHFVSRCISRDFVKVGTRVIWRLPRAHVWCWSWLLEGPLGGGDQWGHWHVLCVWAVLLHSVLTESKGWLPHRATFRSYLALKLTQQFPQTLSRKNQLLGLTYWRRGNFMRKVPKNLETCLKTTSSTHVDLPSNHSV